MNKVLKALGIAVLALVVIIGLGTIVHAAASVGIYPLKNGFSFGAPSDYITFFGGTPVQRQAVTNTPAVAGTTNVTLTVNTGTAAAVTFGTTNIVTATYTGVVVVAITPATVVTNVTGTFAAVYGLCGFQTTNQANQVINALRNLNLAQ